MLGLENKHSVLTQYNKRMAKLTAEAKQKKLYDAIKKAKKALTAKQATELSGMTPDDVKEAGKALMKAGKVRFTGEKNNLLEIVPAKKEAPPAKGKKLAAPKNGKAQDDDDDDDDDDEDEDEEDEDGDWDDDEDEDEDEDGSDDDDDEDEDPDDDEDEDDDSDEDDDDEDEDEDDEDDEDEDEDDEEDEAPAPKKLKSGAKAPAKKTPPAKKSAPAPKAKAKAKAAKEFTLTYKPIDALTNKELKNRWELGLEAAESLFDDGHKEVAELLMRSLAKVKKQIAKRDEDDD